MSTVTGEQSVAAQVQLDPAGIVRSLEPLIAKYADQIEVDRTLPPELVDALYQAGVLRAFTPRSLGGAEMDPLDWMDLVEGISRLNGSVGWIAMIQVGRVFLDEEIMREILKERRWITSGSLLRLGRAHRVEGGYRVSGDWVFASGSPHANFVSGSSILFDDHDEMVLRVDNGRPLLINALFPIADVIYHDNWDGLGLRGTGSGSFSVRDYFLPDKYANRGRGFQNPPAYDRAQDRMAMFHLMGHAAHALGVARGAIDAFIELSVQGATRGDSKRQQSVGRLQYHEIAVAKADALVRAARLLAWDTTARAQTATSDTAAGEMTLGLEFGILMRQSMTFAMRAAREAVELVFQPAGTSAVFRGRRLERCFRDVVTAAQHSLVAETTYDTIGRYYLTRDLPDGPVITDEELPFYHLATPSSTSGATEPQTSVPA